MQRSKSNFELVCNLTARLSQRRMFVMRRHAAFYRAIVSILVAAAIALLPALGAFAAAPTEHVFASSGRVVISAYRCCGGEDMAAHEDMPANKPMGMKDCQSAAACAYKCFNVYYSAFSTPSVRPPPREPLYRTPALAIALARPNPPLRPPRA